MPRLWIIEVLEERRNAITPASPTIEGEIKATVVEPEAAVILPGNQVLGVGRVDFDQLFGLSPVGAILVHAHAPIVESVSITTANRISCNAATVLEGGTQDTTREER